MKVRAKINIFSSDFGYIEAGKIVDIPQSIYERYKNDFEIIEKEEIKQEVPKKIIKKSEKWV